MFSNLANAQRMERRKRGDVSRLLRGLRYLPAVDFQVNSVTLLSLHAMFLHAELVRESTSLCPFHHDRRDFETTPTPHYESNFSRFH